MAQKLTFTVSSYTVEINQKAFSSHFPTITLTGIAGHTPVEAVLEFRPENPSESQVGLITTGGKAYPLFLWFELTAFAGFYQVLSSEKPVSMKIEYGGFPAVPPSQFFIESASLLTGKETPGDYEKS